MNLTVLVGNSSWSYSSDKRDPFTLAGGLHELGKRDLTKELVRALAGAAAAGALVIVDADEEAQKLLNDAIESDHVSQKKLDKAQADGSWQEGNLAQYALEHGGET